MMQKVKWSPDGAYAGSLVNVIGSNFTSSRMN